VSQILALDRGTYPAAAVLVVVVVVAGLAVCARRGRREARRMLVALGASLVCLLSAVMVYVPANPALLPDLAGPRGRPGIAMAVPLALVAVSLLGAIAALARSSTPRAARSVVYVAAAGAFAHWCVAAAVQTRHEASAWATAARRERFVLDVVRRAVPKPRARTAVVLVNAPPDVSVHRAGERTSIAVFQEPFVTSAAMRVGFGRPDLFGVAVRTGDDVRCTSSFLRIARPGYPFPLTGEREGGAARSLYGLGRRFHTRGSFYNVPSTRYGSFVIVDVADGRSFAPLDASACRRALAAA
jgi:hypothetical protein